MHCLKCGKQTKSEHVFCPGCLTVMEAYPVKPDVHIQLPKDANRESPKKSGRKPEVGGFLPGKCHTVDRRKGGEGHVLRRTAAGGAPEK